jgi:quinol monooxygenase YgiN
MTELPLRVLAHFGVQADKVQEFIQSATILLVEPARREPGCIAYELCQDAEDPTRFVMVEEWVNAEALTSHLQRPSLEAAVAQLRPLGSGPVETRRYRSVTAR